VLPYPPACPAHLPSAGRREVFAPGTRGFGHFARRLSRSFRTWHSLSWSNRWPPSRTEVAWWRASRERAR